MINYQGQMYGVVKTFGGGRDRTEEEFFEALAERKANKNINISINVDANEVLSTIFKYLENQNKYNHKEESKEVQNNDLVEGIYFK